MSHDSPTRHDTDADSGTDSQPTTVRDRTPEPDADADAEAVLHDLLAYLDERSRTAATTEPPGARALAELTGRIALPSHRRGYQQGVCLTAEGALDRVVEDAEYCDWTDVRALHAARYGGDADDAHATGAEAHHDRDPDPKPESESPVRTDGGVVSEREPDTDAEPEPDTDPATAAVPPSQRAWTRTRGREAVAEYVAARHADTPAGVPHAAVVTFLLLDHDADPDKAALAIQWAGDDGLIHEPDRENHYRPTDAYGR